MAVKQLDQVLAILPKDNVAQQRKIRLEKAKAQMLARQLPEARKALQGLLDEMLDDGDFDPHLLAETRSTLANSQYYMTWLMRLEGLSKEVWEPEIEAARQHYRLISEQSPELGDCDVVRRSKEDLESAIRLARMDLSELQGLPLPSQ